MPLDLEYDVTVRGVAAEPGELDAPTSSDGVVHFAVHSPSRFFAGHRLTVPEGRSVPQGRYDFMLWRLANGSFDLVVAPVAE